MNKLLSVLSGFVLCSLSFAAQGTVGDYVSGVQAQKYTVTDAKAQLGENVLAEESEGYKLAYAMAHTTAQISVGIVASQAPGSNKTQVQLLMGIPVTEEEFKAVSRNSAYFLEIPAFRSVLSALAKDDGLLKKTLAQTDPFNRTVHVLRIKGVRYAYMPFEFVPNVVAADVDALLAQVKSE